MMPDATAQELERTKDEIYRKVLRAEFGFPGAAEDLTRELAERWASLDEAYQSELRPTILRLIPLALELLDDDLALRQTAQ